LTTDLEAVQRRICARFGSAFVPADPDLKLGAARNALTGAVPLNGLRHPPKADTVGWYIWAGETLSTDSEFFQPLHVRHFGVRCPEVLPYLGLAPGWRFLIAPNHEDVWYDASLLKV
jgi:hypothetical protein